MFIRFRPGFLLCLFILAFHPDNAAAQGYAQQFETLFLNDHPDTAGIKSLLRIWQRFTPEDPQLYIAAFNFHFAQSRREPAPGMQFAADTRLDRSSTSAWTSYDPQRTAHALAWIDEGIRRYPDRLDMWFGKAHALRLTHAFDSLTMLMQRTLDRSVENHNQWRWSDGAMLDSGRRFMLNTMHGYMREMYETGRRELLPYMTQIGASIVKIYPEEVEVMTTTAVGLLLEQLFAQAIAYLKRAERLRPKDVVVLNNMAEGYRLMGDKQAALRYLKLVDAYGDSGQREVARQQMKALRRD